MSKTLLQAAIAWLSAHGAKSCHAWVSDNNFRAISFYKKHGFNTADLKQPLPADPTVDEHLYILDICK